MTIYNVIEYITDDWAENADGYYSTLEQAQQAILERVGEVYTEEEMEKFDFSEDGYSYETQSNGHVVGCTYIIYICELNTPLV